MNKWLKRLIWLIVIAGALAGISVYSARRPMPVEMGEVTRGRVRQYVTEEAKTRLDSERLISALTAGVADRINLEPGDPVEAGQLITKIEDEQLLAQISSMEARIAEIEAMLEGVDVPLPKQAELKAAAMRVAAAERTLELENKALDSARSDLALARSRYERVKRLFEREAVPEDEYERARRDYEVAQLQVESASSRITLAETSIGISRLEETALRDKMDDTRHMRNVYDAQIQQIRAGIKELSTELVRTEVLSPISGVVIEKYHDSRGHVSPQTPLLKVGDPNTIEAEAEILTDEVWMVEEGQNVIITARGLPPDGIEGRVKKIYPSGFTSVSALGVEQQRVLALIDFDRDEMPFGPGYEMDISIITDEREGAILLPSPAVFSTREGPGVFRVRDGRAELVHVETGIEGDDRIEIISGLSPGDSVIMRPPRELESGRRVSPLD